MKALFRERGIEFREIDVASDRMALEDMRQKTGKNFVPQVFIGDEYIGGYEEFILADARGEVDAKLGRATPAAAAPEQVFDLVIIGGGPAGMTAAVYAARKHMRTVLIADQIGGQPMLTSDVENYMGYQFVTGPELMARFEEQIRRYPIDIEVGGRVERLEMEGLVKKVTTTEGRVFRARSVIVATGKQSRTLGIAGEEEYAGRGVSYCATCDGPLFAGEPVMIAGGGNSAMQAALEMAAITEHVNLVSLTRLSGDHVLVGKILAEDRICKHILWRPVEVRGNGQIVTSVIIESADGKDRKELAVKALFIEVGLKPNSAFAVDLLQLNEADEIIVDCDCRTGVRGVFAAGDVTQIRDKQIVVAAGEGAKAALSAHEYLISQK